MAVTKTNKEIHFLRLAELSATVSCVYWGTAKEV